MLEGFDTSLLVMCFLVLLLSSCIGVTKGQDSYLRYYPPFLRQDYSHYAAEVECYTGIGDKYAGNQNYTNSGRPCVDWKQTKYNRVASCVYCRNPNSDSSGPWCYTDGLGARESCHTQIPSCGQVHQFSEESRVRVDTHRWSNTNSTSIYVRFKPLIPDKQTEPIRYSIINIPGYPETYIYLYYNWEPQTGGYVKLEWRYHEGSSPIVLQSETKQHRFYRVWISRDYQDLSMIVNDIVYVSERQSPVSEFEDKGVFEIGYGSYSEETQFAGCMSNLEYNGIEPLAKLDTERVSRSSYDPSVTVTGEVTKTDTCMYTAPNDFVQPPYSNALRVGVQLAIQPVGVQLAELWVIMAFVTWF